MNDEVVGEVVGVIVDKQQQIEMRLIDDDELVIQKIVTDSN